MAEARKLTVSEEVEIVSALRLTANRYQKSAEAWRQSGMTDSEAYWTKCANRCAELADLISTGLRVVVALDGEAEKALSMVAAGYLPVGGMWENEQPPF